MHWEKYRYWAMWIVGGRYITTLSFCRPFDEVINAAIEEAEKLGIFANQTPTILVNSYVLGQDEYDACKNLPEGHISITLE